MEIFYTILHIVMIVIVFMWLIRGTRLAKKPVDINKNSEKFEVMVGLTNKLLGCFYVIGSLIALAILVS